MGIGDYNKGRKKKKEVLNKTSLSDAMKKMYYTIDKYDSQSISQDCFDRFSPSVIAAQLIDVFDSAIKKHSLCNN